MSRSSPAGGIVTVSDDGLLYDGEPLSDRTPPGTYYYADRHVPRLVEISMLPTDDGRRRQHGQPSYMLRRGRRRYRILPASVWGWRRGDDLSEHLSRMRALVTDAGLEWGNTAGTLAGRFLRRRLRGHHGGAAVRRLALASLHQGPTYVCSGGSVDAIAVDRTEAYLNSMRCLLPDGPWRQTGPCPWESIEIEAGFCDVTVYVNMIPYPMVPLRLTTTIYPTGCFRTQLSISLLRSLVYAGDVSVIAVHDAVVSDSYSDYLSVVADRIAAVEPKELRKLLYTRAWALPASHGGLIGVTHDAPPPKGCDPEDWIEIEGSELRWYEPDVDYATNNPVFRPDISATIAADNCIEVAKAAPKRGIIAMHIDCYWQDSSGDVSIRDGWRVKDQGPLRFNACGTYQHNKTRGCMVRRAAGETSNAMRHWYGNPWTDISAYSVPFHFDAPDGEPIPASIKPEHR